MAAQSNDDKEEPKNTSNNSKQQTDSPEEKESKLVDEVENNDILDAEKDINKFKEKKLAELNAREAEIKQEYDTNMKKALFGKSAEEQRQILQNEENQNYLNSLQNEYKKIAFDKYKVQQNPKQFLDEEKYKQQLSDMEKKYSGIETKKDESPFNHDKYLSKDYLKQEEIQKKIQRYYEQLRSDPKQAEEMLNSDFDLKEIIKKREISKLEQMENKLNLDYQSLMKNKKDEKDAAGITEYIKTEKEKIQNLENSYYSRFPEEKEAKDKQKIIDHKFENPIERDFLSETKRDTKGNVILLASDVHENLEGLEAVFNKGRELKKQGKLNSIVLAGDLIRGVFLPNERDEFIKYQKVFERLHMMQSMKGQTLFTASPFELLDDNGNIREEIQRSLKEDPLDFQKDFENTLKEYANLHVKTKKNLKDKLTKIKELADRYEITKDLNLVSGNYEGVQPLLDVFGEENVLGFGNIAEHDYQIRYDERKNKDINKSFRSKVIDSGGLRFFWSGWIFFFNGRLDSKRTFRILW
ncbi:MAG: hypothetical protein WC755_02645 [Candidatus Woesearchaeota archaeon]|jgi:Icc-related predicted phosphoesterase